jgi:hypothetical protein
MTQGGAGAPKIAVLMLLAPGETDIQRARDTVASIAAWEPAVRWIVCVDDEPDRTLEPFVPDIEIIRRPPATDG